MIRHRLLAAATLVALATTPVAVAAVTDPTSTIDGLRGDQGERAITYVGTIRDQPDLAAAGLGADGYWFAQFDAGQPTSGAPTGDNARDGLPTWVGAFNHTTGPADPGCTEPDALPRGCLPTYAFRTFSQDGPARSAGGVDEWARLRLPDASCGGAGAIVDPQTFLAGPNNNNTVNRIQLQDGVPDRFYLGIVTDTTAGQFDPGRVEIRGNVGVLDQQEDLADSQVEATTAPSDSDLATNGVPDVHLFLVEHFRSGDYLKLRLRGIDAPASFSGLVFDRDPDLSGPDFDPPGTEQNSGRKLGHLRLGTCAAGG